MQQTACVRFSVPKYIISIIVVYFFYLRVQRASFGVAAVGVVGEHPASPPPPIRVPPSWAVAALAAAAAAGAVLGLASCLLLRPPCRERQDAPASPTASSPVSASASAVTPVSLCVVFCFVFVCIFSYVSVLVITASFVT